MRRWMLVAGGVLIVGTASLYHYVDFLPHPDRPTKLYLLDVVFEACVAGLIALSAATLGVRLLHWLRAQGATRLERALLAYGLGSGVLALLTAIVGLAHGYYFPILCLLLLGPMVVWRQEFVAVCRAVWPASPHFVLGELVPETTTESVVFAAVVLMAILIGEHALVPFWGFDVFMYHFAMPERYLTLHALISIPGTPQADLPYNNEMLNLLALNFQAEIGAAMLQTGFVVLSCLAVFVLGLRFFSRQVAWLGMAFFLALPLVLYYSTSGLIDCQFAFVALITILALEIFRQERSRRWLITAGLLIGIGFGVKYQTIYLVAPLMIALLWWLRPVPFRLSADWLRVVAVDLGLLAGAALVTFVLWPLREWVQLGNPVYPLVWGGAEWTRQRMTVYTAQFQNFGSLRHSILRYAIATFDWFWHWQRYDYTPTPPLPAYALAAAAPVALILPGPARRRGNVALLLWLVVCSFTLWGLIDQLVPRYVLPSFGLIALLAAYMLEQGIDWLLGSRAERRRALVFSIALLVALLPGLSFVMQMRVTSDPSPVYLGQESYTAYVRDTQLWPSYWRMADYLNSEVPLTTKILGVNLAATYFLRDPYVSPDMNRDIIPYLDEVAPTDEQKLAWLHREGYRYVIYDRTVTQWSLDRDPANLLTPLLPPFESFLAQRLILVRSLDGTDVYQVPPA